MKLVTFVLLAATIEICASLTCSDSCKAKRCARLAQRLDCVGNLVKDACGCCYECAKQLNNTCGGIYNANGICDAGLACYHIPPSLPALHPGICSRKGKRTIVFRGVTDNFPHSPVSRVLWRKLWSVD